MKVELVIDRLPAPHDAAARAAAVTGHLAALTGRSAEAIELRRDAAGRPFLVPPGPDFSVSHSGPLLAVAVCDGARVGVDVELMRPRRRLPQIAERAFPAEPAAGADPERFYALWTAYEAFAKAHGTGLGLPARDLAVEEGPDGELELAHPAVSGGPWAGRRIRLEGAVATVVAAAPRCEIRRRTA